MIDKLIITVLILAGVAVATTGCVAVNIVRGTGGSVEKEIGMDAINAVALHTIGTLHIEIGSEEHLIIKAESNIIDQFTFNVTDGRLNIRTRPGVIIRPNAPVHFYLTAVSLDDIKLTGSGDAYVPDMKGERLALKTTGSGNLDAGELVMDDITVKITSSGDIDIDAVKANTYAATLTGSGKLNVGMVELDDLNVHQTGSGRTTIDDGVVREQEVKLTGSGPFRAPDLESDRAIVTITGSGGTDIQVSDYLQVRITGSGDVHYDGSPELQSTITGSGRLAAAGD